MAILFPVLSQDPLEPFCELVAVLSNVRYLGERIRDEFEGQRLNLEGIFRAKGYRCLEYVARPIFQASRTLNHEP